MVDEAAVKTLPDESSSAIATPRGRVAKFVEKHFSEVRSDKSAERERAICERTQKLKPALVKDEVGPDGSCFYHSVARQTIGKDEHLNVRASIVDEVQENGERYDDFTT